MEWSRPVAVVLAAGAIALAVVSTPARGADDPGVIPFQVEVGEAKRISAGPVREFICDEGGLVELAFTDAGVVLKGLRTGTTLCSFRDPSSVRMVLRVVVVSTAPGSAPSPRGS